jgi:hypothetical protein
VPGAISRVAVNGTGYDGVSGKSVGGVGVGGGENLAFIALIG